MDALNDTFAYDNASRLTQANSGHYNNLVTRAYDAGGRKVSEALTVNGQTYPVASGYDAANRRTAITYPNGKVIAQTFTNRDQLLNVKYDAVNVSTFAYDLGGRKTTNTFGNSKVETRTYRADNRTNTIVTPTGITNFAYAWDVNKNKTQENDAALPTNVQDYSYDNEDRLTGFARNSGQTQAWTLSLVGDWSAFNDNGSAQTRTHNAVHELTGINANPLTYDAKGNLTTNSNGQTHTWDFKNCMKTAVVGADTATYTYDAFRRRVAKNFQGTTTVFVYDGWRSVAEYENGAALTSPARLYVFGTYIDEALMMLVGSTKYYYHANDLYSVAALTNSAGTVVERYRYDPYGKVTVLDASGTAKSDPNNSEYGNPFTYTGQRLDKETGLMYYKNRYYSTEMGRFVSRDPIGYRGSEWSLYEYAGGRATKSFDSFGTTVNIPKEYDRKFILGLMDKLCPDGKWYTDSDGNVQPGNYFLCNSSVRTIRRSDPIPSGCSFSGFVDKSNILVRKGRECGESQYPVSCCCLCDAITSKRKFTIQYVMVRNGSSTIDENPQIEAGLDILGGVPGAGDTAFPAGGMVRLESWLIFGHELCGHAIPRAPHGPGVAYTRRDPVIWIENQIRAEHSTPQNNYGVRGTP